jgi:Tfp pilus assembly protein PilX
MMTDNELHTQDRGAAMIMVLGMMSIMTVVVAAALAYATTVAPQVSRDENWQAALAAAQAGVDDYLAKLNRTDAYAQTVDCANVALKGPKAETNSCGWNSSTAPGWVAVQAGKPEAGKFHYDVNTANFWKDGSVWVESTGKVRGVSRTIQVRVARGGSTDFLYYTDFEDADPQNLVAYPPGGSKSLATGGAKYDVCGKSGPTLATYWWQGGTRVNSSYCQEIQFAGNDVLDGDVHFNDSPLMSSAGGTRPRFLKGYEVADPNCTEAAGRPDASGIGTNAGDGKCWRSTSSTNPYVGTAGARPALTLYLPDNSDKFATYPGCNYYGDTRIRFNSNGTMTVWNTTSSGKNLKGPGSAASLNCGNAAQFIPASGKKYPAAGQTIPVPEDLVIYVQASTSGSAACTPGQIVNGTTSGSTANDQIPVGVGTAFSDVDDISYYNPASSAFTTTKRWKYSTTTKKWALDTGYTNPTLGTVVPNNDAHPQTFDCGLGNVYIEGTVKGRVTIAAQNNVIITGDLAINSTTKGNTAIGPDMVGLVAANSVVIYHPVSRGSSNAEGTPTPVASPTSLKSVTCPTTSTSTSLPTTSTNNPTNGSTITCTWTTTTTYNSTYSNISYPGATNSSGTRWIYASIQTLQRSFWVQNYNQGADLGTLAVRGSIAQKWRGAVGTSGGTGFAKDYSYDTRLQFASPPYFPQWTNAAWGSKVTGELPAKY